MSHIVKPASSSTTSEQPHRGGILRLPPDAMMTNNSTTPSTVMDNSSQSSDWRAHPPPPSHQQPQPPHQQPQHYQQQPARHGVDHYNHSHYNENTNPAWRGISEHYRQPLTASTATAATSGDRYLYDPRNPKKPIPAQRGSGVRFPMDPRFAPPPTATVTAAGSSAGSGHPGPPRMAGYRPPFPPTTTSNSSSSMMPGLVTGTVLATEGGEAAQILGKNQMMFRGPRSYYVVWVFFRHNYFST